MSDAFTGVLGTPNAGTIKGVIDFFYDEDFDKDELEGFQFNYWY